MIASDDNTKYFTIHINKNNILGNVFGTASGRL